MAQEQDTRHDVTLNPAADGLAAASEPAEQSDPGGNINGKAVWSLPGIFDNFFRQGHWPDGGDPTTYSIPNARPSGYVGTSGEGKTFSALNEMQRTAVHYVMDQLDGFVALDFTDVGTGDGGDIRFMNNDEPDGTAAHAKGPWKRAAVDGDIWIGGNRPGNFDFDDNGAFNPVFSSGIYTMLHELGHVMGLSHPGDYDASDAGTPTYAGDAEIFQDFHQYTLMSYFDSVEAGVPHSDTGVPNTYMLHDVYALQREYGAEMTTRTGNTIYGFNSNAGDIYHLDVNSTPRYCIWDAGGFDTLNLADSEVDVHLDLRAGHFSSINGFTDNVSIAYDFYATNAALVAIEAAIGGDGDDVIIGNFVGNQLSGGGGADDISGGDGIDLIQGGSGEDELDGDDGNDVLFGGDGEDTLRGDIGADWMSGDDDADLLYGGEGDDEMDGGAGRDMIFGEDGNDTLVGGDDQDSLFGGEGEDLLQGGGGNDTLYGSFGLDTFEGGGGFDIVDFVYSDQDWTVHLAFGGVAGAASFGAGTETLLSIEGVRMGSGNDTIHLSIEDNYVDAGAGNDTILRATGQNTIRGGDGFDHLSYANAFHGVTVDLQRTGLQKVIDRDGFVSDEFDSIADIERLTGSAFDDVLIGNSQANDLFGNWGDDLLSAAGGNDTLNGGDGRDTLLSGSGNDSLNGAGGLLDVLSFEYATGAIEAAIGDGGGTFAGLGTDSWGGIEGLRGSNFDDTLSGTSEANVLQGGSGNDELHGRGGNDTIDGGFGNDLIEADLGIRLQVGNDSVRGGFGADTVRGSFGDDVLFGDQGDDQLFGGEGNDTLDGGRQNDFLDAGSGNNELIGGTGSDTLKAGTGNDDLRGGTGTDYADYRGLAEFVAINLNQVFQNPQGAGSDQLREIEGVFGTEHNDILFGRGQSWSRLHGEGGSDSIQGGLGDDGLYGGAGNDTINDSQGDDTVDGGVGRDRATYYLASSGVTIDLGSMVAQNTGGAGTDVILGIEDLVGSDFADVLFGNALDNALTGNAGNDFLSGRGGLDHLHGEEGNDTLDGGAGDDWLDGGDGTDVASYASATAGVIVSLANVNAQFTGGAGWDLLTSIEQLFGSEFADHLTGSDADNVIHDGAGHDTVFAGGGNDVVFGGAQGSDVYDGGTGFDRLSFTGMATPVNVNLVTGRAIGLLIGIDTISGFEAATGGSGNDSLRGDAGSNLFSGERGNDLLAGEAGQDTLVGGVGNDVLTGGAEADRFDFSGGDGQDSITDFEHGLDLIRFASGPDSMADLLLAGSTVTYGSSNITLVGVDATSLTAADFLFA